MHLTIAQLIEDTGLSEDTIKQLRKQRRKLDKEAEKYAEDKEKKEKTKTTTTVKKKTIDDHMGKKKGAVVMTEAASMLGDEATRKNVRSIYEHDGVTKIRPD